MLIGDPVKDFYRKIIHQRVLVLVGLDVDALCACKILQCLFKCDQVQHTIVPIADKIGMEKAFHDHNEQYKQIIMLNCGGNMDLLEILQPPDDVVIYVADSHRPVDLVNFYCERQIYLIMRNDHEELDAIPDYENLYRDGESEDDGSESDTDETEQRSKRKRFDEETLLKMREKRNWEEKRKEIIFDYEEFSFHGTAVSLLMYELAWKMSKDNNDILWWGIVGVADQFHNKKIGRDKYVSNVLELQGHMSRLNHQYEDEEHTASINCMKINFEHDLDLALYRHWSLFESLCHSPSTLTAFKIWTTNGMKKLHQFLAEMGIPLAQSKQTYSFMDSKVRENFQSLVEESAQKFGLTNVKYQSFSAYFGYSHKMCATDVVYAVGALLEECDTDDLNPCVNFVQALDSLSRIDTENLQTGIKSAKMQLQAMKNHISTFIEIGQVMSYGPFLYSYVKEGSPDVKYFRCPIYLTYFSHLLLHTYLQSLGSNKREKAKNLPLIMCAPKDEEQGNSIVIGIPPLSEDSRRNLFGRAFLHASQRTNSRTEHNFFDTCSITVKNQDRSKFLDALITILS